MKKAFKLEELDCANCAAKMEAAIGKLPGVNKATVSFMAQKLILDAEDDRFDEILKPEAFTGMASQQVADYLATVVRPALEAHASDRTTNEEEVRV